MPRARQHKHHCGHIKERAVPKQGQPCGHTTAPDQQPMTPTTRTRRKPYGGDEAEPAHSRFGGQDPAAGTWSSTAQGQGNADAVSHQQRWLPTGLPSREKILHDGPPVTHDHRRPTPHPAHNDRRRPAKERHQTSRSNPAGRPPNGRTHPSTHHQQHPVNHHRQPPTTAPLDSAGLPRTTRPEPALSQDGDAAGEAEKIFAPAISGLTK
jgi:hypothetical protein